MLLKITFKVSRDRWAARSRRSSRPDCRAELALPTARDSGDVNQLDATCAISLARSERSGRPKILPTVPLLDFARQ
jgi:hypothetical protein